MRTRPLLADLWANNPVDRLHAARAQDDKARRALAKLGEGWPPYSPGALNAWLLLVTTKPPTWRDPLSPWAEFPPALGEPHPNLFYPDPLGFWAEVRRWELELLRPEAPQWSSSEALSVAAVLHVGDQPRRFELVRSICKPRLVLFLDEPSFLGASLHFRPTVHHIADPHRPGKFYEGLWGRADDGMVVGKSPQHPTAHRLYEAKTMTEFLRAAPQSDEAS